MNGTSSNLTNGTNGAPQINTKNYEQEQIEMALEELYDNNNPFDQFPLTINLDKQSKHIKGSNNYIDGRSEITINKNELQQLVNLKATRGEYVSPTKERVNFGKVIGLYADLVTGRKIPTTQGIIHYSKVGVHVVPANPKESKND
ncbi:MAG: hypothetical protein IKI71_00695 [Lachnospiraceae bacterium]|nr:hypothetical protein [Lachnospiraceae bacterium]